MVNLSRARGGMNADLARARQLSDGTFQRIGQGAMRQIQGRMNDTFGDKGRGVQSTTPRLNQTGFAESIAARPELGGTQAVRPHLTRAAAGEVDAFTMNFFTAAKGALPQGRSADNRGSLDMQSFELLRGEQAMAEMPTGGTSVVVNRSIDVEIATLLTAVSGSKRERPLIVDQANSHPAGSVDVPVLRNQGEFRIQRGRQSVTVSENATHMFMRIPTQINREGQVGGSKEDIVLRVPKEGLELGLHLRGHMRDALDTAGIAFPSSGTVYIKGPEVMVRPLRDLLTHENGLNVVQGTPARGEGWYINLSGQSAAKEAGREIDILPANGREGVMQAVAGGAGAGQILRAMWRPDAASNLNVDIGALMLGQFRGQIQTGDKVVLDGPDLLTDAIRPHLEAMDVEIVRQPADGIKVLDFTPSTASRNREVAVEDAGANMLRAFEGWPQNAVEMIAQRVEQGQQSITAAHRDGNVGANLALGSRMDNPVFTEVAHSLGFAIRRGEAEFWSNRTRGVIDAILSQHPESAKAIGEMRNGDRMVMRLEVDPSKDAALNSALGAAIGVSGTTRGSPSSVYGGLNGRYEIVLNNVLDLQRTLGAIERVRVEDGVDSFSLQVTTHTRFETDQSARAQSDRILRQLSKDYPEVSSALTQKARHELAEIQVGGHTMAADAAIFALRNMAFSRDYNTSGPTPPNMFRVNTDAEGHARISIGIRTSSEMRRFALFTENYSGGVLNLRPTWTHNQIQNIRP